MARDGQTRGCELNVQRLHGANARTHWAQKADQTCLGQDQAELGHPEVEADFLHTPEADLNCLRTEVCFKVKA